MFLYLSVSSLLSLQRLFLQNSTMHSTKQQGQHLLLLLTLSLNILLLIGSFSFQALIFFSPLFQIIFSHPLITISISPQQSVLCQAHLPWYHLSTPHSQLFVSSTDYIIYMTFIAPLLHVMLIDFPASLDNMSYNSQVMLLAQSQHVFPFLVFHSKTETTHHILKTIMC